MGRSHWSLAMDPAGVGRSPAHAGLQIRVPKPTSRTSRTCIRLSQTLKATHRLSCMELNVCQPTQQLLLQPLFNPSSKIHSLSVPGPCSLATRPLNHSPSIHSPKSLTSYNTTLTQQSHKFFTRWTLLSNTKSSQPFCTDTSCWKIATWR
jgi:hypothetical protein